MGLGANATSGVGARRDLVPITLATCVPYIPNDSQIGRSLLVLLVAKPLTYVCFVLCFRYRVSLPKPMSYPRIAAIVMLAAAAGFALIGADALTRWSFHSGHFTDRGFLNWSLLVAFRVGTWTFLGGWLAGLRGRRPLGWIASAAGIDLAFDFALSAAYDGSWIESGYAGLFLLSFLIPLYMIGRRPSLKSRFLAAHLCRQCAYDLTGNASGICPECGMGVQ